MTDFPFSPVSERLRQFAAYGDTAEGRILAQLALTEIERLRGHAQTPADLGMHGAVQYRRKDGGYGPRWITMAMFDGTLAAENYCNLQRKDDKWPFEYRAIELPATPDTSTNRGGK